MNSTDEQSHPFHLTLAVEEPEHRQEAIDLPSNQPLSMEEVLSQVTSVMVEAKLKFAVEKRPESAVVRMIFKSDNKDANDGNLLILSSVTWIIILRRN